MPSSKDLIDLGFCNRLVGKDSEITGYGISPHKDLTEDIKEGKCTLFVKL